MTQSILALPAAMGRPRGLRFCGPVLCTVVAALLLAAWPAALPAQAATQPASQPAATQPSAAGQVVAYGGGAVDLRSAGFHKLLYCWTEDGQNRHMPFSLFLPQGYGQDDRRWPMLTFLGGLGDRGEDPGIAMSVGVPLELGRSAELAQWMPMIVLTPQCPADKVWDSPGVSQDVLRLVHAMMDRLAVDDSRLYVSGFSDGGRGSWVVASDEPNLFAVTAPIVSREHHAEQTAARLAGSGITCLVLSGMKDPKSEPASANMVAALRKQHVDVVYAPVPEAEHFIWRAYYSQKEFYQWLLLHRRGQGPPADRLSAQKFIELYTSRQQLSFQRQVLEYRLQRSLDLFEPYWFIDNCAESSSVGLRSQLRGRKNVYVTVPLSAEIPCRLQTTRQLPAEKATELQVEVGHASGTQWELVIRVNEQEQVRTLINDQTAPDGWRQIKLDLRPYAGKEARLQLINYASGQGSAAAYWARMKLIETGAK